MKVEKNDGTKCAWVAGNRTSRWTKLQVLENSAGSRQEAGQRAASEPVGEVETVHTDGRSIATRDSPSTIHRLRARRVARIDLATVLGYNTHVKIDG